MKHLFLAIIFSVTIFAGNATVFYVNMAATTGLRNGTSWANAYTSLDTALILHTKDTLWVANGTYTGYFVVTDSVKVFGGFTGTETTLTQRSFTTYQTILQQISPFIYPIVVMGAAGFSTIPNVDCRIDGFKFQNSSRSAIGIGSNFTTDKIVITNCYFTGNTGDNAGAIGVNGAQDATISNCLFWNNTSRNRGGAIYRIKGTNYLNSNNFNVSTLNVTDCRFYNNTAEVGGAICIRDTAATIINRCLFMGNKANAYGGALYDSSSANLQVYNSVIVGNKAVIGSAHYSADTQYGYRPHSFIHCTIANNLGTAQLAKNYSLWLRRADVLKNNIIWGDSSGLGLSPELANPTPGAVYSSNVIQGPVMTGTSLGYNFNPLFISSGSAGLAPFPMVNGYNYHLNRWSAAIDTAVNLSLPTSYNLDLDGTARVQGPKPDLGAYEWKVCIGSTVSISAGGPTDFCAPGSVALTANSSVLNPTVNYQWNGGSTTGKNITASITGVYTVVTIDSNGCRATASVTVNAVATPNPVITQTGNTLSVPAIYATYQWYKGGVLITGATSATYNPSSNGSYSVKVTTVIAGCAGTSALYNLHNLSVEQLEAIHDLKIFPNPATSGRFNISFVTQQQLKEVSITATSITGQQVWGGTYYNKAGNSFLHSMDLGTVAKGMYFISVRVEGVTQTGRLMID